MSRTVMVTVDIEEWYHLEYLQKGQQQQPLRVIPYLQQFLDVLERLEIKATFFTLGEIAQENKALLQQIAASGHEIACHGYDHELLYNKDNDAFRAQVALAKATLEQISGQPVTGYRASCFSMENEKLQILQQLGFTYDSSYIKFQQHDLYNVLNMASFAKIGSLVYKKDAFYEIEIPTLQVGKYNIPISGGGYIRLFPLWLLKRMFKKYFEHENRFQLYLHPYELTDVDIPIAERGDLKKQFRMNVGRKQNLRKIEHVLTHFKEQGVTFQTMSELTANL